MARARNIKPALFLNDDLAENNCPLGRLLFIGLWTIADYKGDLEWRAGRIKTQILPYDDCDIKKLAINLDKSGFVRFYSDSEKVYLNITNFVKHQNPHKNERESGSDIPEYSSDMRQVVDLSTLTINRDKSGLIQDKDGTNPADSLLLIPDSSILIPHSVDSSESPVVQKDFVSEQFARFWRNFPYKKSKVQTEKSFKKLMNGKRESQVVFWVDFILSYHLDCIDRKEIGADKLHPSTLINQRRWEDNPEFFANFKKEWIAENGQD